MSQYYQNQQRQVPQQRRQDGGSVKQARERAEALAYGQSVQPVDPRWPSTRREYGRSYIPRAVTRQMTNNAPPHNAEYIQPPPPVWRTAPYSSEHGSPITSVEDLTVTPKRQRDRGEMAQDFRFPQVPKSTNSSPQSARRIQRPQGRHQAPLQPTSNSPALPSAKSSRAQVAEVTKATSQKYASPIITQQADPYQRESVYSRPSEPGTPRTPQGVVRKASTGKKAKPVLTTVRTPEMRENFAGPPSSRANEINTLSAAIAAGMRPGSRPQTPSTQAMSSPIRMPFADESPPHSPIDEKVPLEPPRVFGKSPVATTRSGNSTNSSNPLLGTDSRPGMSNRIPLSRRPPPLNIEAVREADARASVTSLAELIRRATKLASNLDRGKTASRLGMLDMFNGGEKGHASGSISDMLSAFPEPGVTPSSTRSQDPRFPLGSSRLRDGELAQFDSRNFQTDKWNRRRYCGMSLRVFSVVLFILVILIAAAIIVPILLTVIPRMHDASNNLAFCSTSHVCQNMGISVISSNSCSCVCINGYTGDHCQAPLDADCSTTDVTINGKAYDGATAGSSLPDILSGASKNFNIPLNSTALLSLFATNNLSCITENSLVNFNVQTQNQKRFFPIHVPIPTDIPTMQNIKARIPQPSTVASTNGIVFQAPTTSATIASSTASSRTQTASSLSPSSSVTAVSQKTLSFAQVVVLYVFEQSSTLTIAINAQQTMQSYLANVGGDANGTLSVGYQSLHLSADFKNFEVLWANGSSVGGVKERMKRSWEGWREMI